MLNELSSNYLKKNGSKAPILTRHTDTLLIIINICYRLLFLVIARSFFFKSNKQINMYTYNRDDDDDDGVISSSFPS